jgi:hypothetical protein
MSSAVQDIQDPHGVMWVGWESANSSLVYAVSLYQGSHPNPKNQGVPTCTAVQLYI